MAQKKRDVAEGLLQRWLFDRFGVTSIWWMLLPLALIAVLVVYGLVMTVATLKEPAVGYECVALYAKARTAADTQAVDRMRVPLNPGKGSVDQLYCGVLREEGRLAPWERRQVGDSVSGGG